MNKVSFTLRMNKKIILRLFSTINPKELNKTVMSETTYINSIYKNSLLSFGGMTLGASYLCTIPFSPALMYLGMGMSLGSVLGFTFTKPQY